MHKYTSIATVTAMLTVFAIAATTMPIQNIYASIDHPDDNINQNALKACEHTDKPQFCPSDDPGDGDEDEEDDGGNGGPPDP
jgi:hypothetical protein